MNNKLKRIFTLLVIASVIAIIAGTYLGAALGMRGGFHLSVLAAIGILLWAMAWGEFLTMCLRLRRDETAFTAATGWTLQNIGRCMVGLAVVTCLAAMLGSDRTPVFLLLEALVLPGLFLAVSLAARILRGLLLHAMTLEAEQEGIV